MAELKQLIVFLKDTNFLKVIGTLVMIISIFIEITPIKVNPISSFFKWFGKKINGEVLQKVDSLQKQVDKIQHDNGHRSAVNCRVRILSFGDEIRQGMRHSKENFDQIIEDIDNYEEYCKKHPDFKNNRTSLTTQRILEAYSSSMDNNDFL